MYATVRRSRSEIDRNFYSNTFEFGLFTILKEACSLNSTETWSWARTNWSVHTATCANLGAAIGRIRTYREWAAWLGEVSALRRDLPLV